MRFLHFAVLLACLPLLAATPSAQAAAPTQSAATHPSSASAAIRRVLADQQAAWNHGDITTFMRGYDNSPRTTFIGKTISYGYQPILARYKKAYATRAAMGTLTFSGVTVKMLGANYAVVTGRYHLTRSASAGGDASGIYSLIFARKPAGWRIILDHTSSD
ncbi:MAG TPA: nuclear transport factor 2 family protein [Acidobacteriaceae bacterium]|nr:nuclear transport factor 2 family protein [Acidobacteriaceae bacterium]